MVGAGSARECPVRSARPGLREPVGGGRRGGGETETRGETEDGGRGCGGGRGGGRETVTRGETVDGGRETVTRGETVDGGRVGGERGINGP